MRAAIDRAAARGQAAITMIDESGPVAVFAVADAVREQSREAVSRLHEQGIEVVMMTCDAKAVANAVAQALGIDAGAVGNRAASCRRRRPYVIECDRRGDQRPTASRHTTVMRLSVPKGHWR